MRADRPAYHRQGGSGSGAAHRRSWRSALIAALAALILPLMAMPAAAQDEPPPPEETIEPPADRAPLTYTVDFDGVESADLLSLLRRSSELIAQQDNPPQTEGRLNRRIEQDAEAFAKVLRSQGYYAGKVSYDVNRSQQPIAIEFTIDSGPLYRLAEYRIAYAEAKQTSWLPQGAEAVGLEIGMPAAGQPIVDAQGRLIRTLKERGYPLARVLDRRAVVDHEARTLSVTLSVDQGPLAGYGPVTVEGLEDVETAYVLRLVDLEPGARYDQSEVDKIRARLSETQLFAGVSVEPGDAVNERGNIPIIVRLTEREHRTVGGSLGWSTSEGFRSEAYWQHRNLLGHNEQLRLAATLAEIEQSFSAALRRPHFRRIDQDLLAEAAALRRTTDAFDELSARTYLGLQRPIWDTWRISGGVSLEYSILDEKDEPRTKFLLLGLPLTASQDTTDNILDPTEGHRLGFTLTPYFGTVERNIGFVNATAQGSTYYAVDDEARYVLAGRARIGTILGAGLFDLPANKRFYAGGGGSVRGYAFQSAGPLDEDDDPIGGRSLLELGAEMRIKITENIGIVPFIDAGTVFEDSYPSKLGDLLVGAGLGGRYYTGFGPIRLDVAFPLTPRDSDDFFQFYVSLGQAF